MEIRMADAFAKIKPIEKIKPTEPFRLAKRLNKQREEIETETDSSNEPTIPRKRDPLQLSGI
jgi:hypothetical protein